MTVTRKARAMLLMPLMMGLAVACSDQPLESPVVETETLTPSIDVVAGDAQVGTAGQQLPDPLVVRLTDPLGRPLDEQPVTFHVTSGEGSVFAGSVLTDEEGRAQEWWTLGSAEGDNTLEARAVDPESGESVVQARFSAKGVAVAAQGDSADQARGGVSSRPSQASDPAWNRGVWNISGGGVSAVLDLDRGTITIPRYGTFDIAARTTGNRLIVTIEAGSYGSGTMSLTHANGELRGTATGEGRNESVVGRRSSTPTPTPAPDAPNNPRPSQPAPSQPPPSQPAPSQPPAAGGNGKYPNEPANFVMITDRGFNGRDEGGWSDRAAPASSGIRASFDIVSDPTAPQSPGGVARVTLPTGYTGAGSSSRMVGSRIQIGTPDKIYMSFWLKVSDNWFNHTGASISKLFYIGHPLYLGLRGSGNSPLQFQFSLQGGESSNARWNDSDNRVRARAEQAEIVRGEWHQVEILVEMNDPGASNGRLHAWIDGVKTHEFHNKTILASGGGQYGEIGHIDYHPIYGGANGRDVPETQHQYLDHVYVSRSR